MTTQKTMPIQPIRDSKGNIILNGALTDFELWDRDAGLVLLVKLEQFLITDSPPKEDPMISVSSESPHPDEDSPCAPNPLATADAPEGTRGNTGGVRVVTFQIAIPYYEALKLGWSLAEAAMAGLHPPGSEPRQ